MSLYESIAFKMLDAVDELSDADCFDDLNHNTDDLIAREQLYLLSLRYVRNYQRLLLNEKIPVA